MTFKTVRATYRSDSRIHLDNANDAWLRDNGAVSVRDPGNYIHQIGQVDGLRGAARVSRALKIVREHRAA